MNKFIKFTESLKTNENAPLIEAIKEGYKVLHEYGYDLDDMSNTDSYDEYVISELQNIAKEPQTVDLLDDIMGVMMHKVDADMGHLYVMLPKYIKEARIPNNTTYDDLGDSFTLREYIEYNHGYDYGHEVTSD